MCDCETRPFLLGSVSVSVPLLDLDSYNASRRSFFQGLPHLGHQWKEIINVVALCCHQDDYQVQHKKTLLILEALVYGEKRAELWSGTTQERPIFNARPAHLGHSSDLVIGKLTFELPWHALIQQHAH